MNDWFFTFITSFFVAGSIVFAMMYHTHLMIKQAHTDYNNARHDLEHCENILRVTLANSCSELLKLPNLSSHDKEDIKLQQQEINTDMPLGTQLGAWMEAVKTAHRTNPDYNCDLVKSELNNYIQARALLGRITAFINDRAFLKNDQVDEIKINDKIDANFKFDV